MQQGILYESMNMAALWGLPVVFVCINNQYGMGTRVDQATANTAFDQRAHAFGLNGAVVDGIDVEEVKNAAQGLIDDARLGKPGFLSVTCYRFFGHARMDKSPYRAEAEELEGRKKDPVKFTRDRLVSSGLAQEAALDAMDGDITAEMDATIDFTVESKAPPLTSMFKDVYAVGEPEPEPVRTRIDRVLSKDEA
jgi:pyruvate dehydrogenase E1 component alpha subunit